MTVRRKQRKRKSLKSCAQKLGSQGGIKGGPARALKLSRRRRRAIAREGALARYSR